MNELFEWVYQKTMQSLQGTSSLSPLKRTRKHRAHGLVSRALRDGVLTRQPCEICGDTDTIAHHDNYAAPLAVRWLCRAHHADWHAANGEALNAWYYD